MIEFLTAAKGMPHKPLMIGHHTSRSTSRLDVYGQNAPRDFRNGNAIADIYAGFEGAPGHEAGPLVGRTAATRRIAASTR